MQQNAKELSASRALLHPLKIAVIRNSPASRQTAWCWASFMLRFGAFLRIKSPMCRSFFYAVLTYCALPITVTARSWSKNEHFSLYREKAREEKEGKHRLWERCVNRLRFSAVSIAAAREKREGGFFAQAACRRSFALPFLPEYQGLFCIIVRRNRAKVLLYPFIKVKAHGFCIGNPEPAHPVTLAGNPVLAGDSAKRVK